MRRIRDHMDDILEARGYYRKHVAKEADSIFRSVADVLFSTQLADMTRRVKEAFQVRMMTANLTESFTRERKHDRVQHLADLLDVTFYVVEANDSQIGALKFPPRTKQDIADNIFHYDQETRLAVLACDVCLRRETDPPLNQDCDQRITRKGRKKAKKTEGQMKCTCSVRGSSADTRTIFLCFSGDSQYDPVYQKRTIDIAALVQSILYDMLYTNVFQVPDAYQAADLMLNGMFDPVRGKPDVYDKDFEGTALEALDRFLIPFPYKVAKALDAEHYRNIEFDVWTCESRSLSTSSSGVKGGRPISSSNRSTMTIGSLRRGTQCLLRLDTDYDVIGFIQGPTSDRRHMIIFVPPNSNYVIPRKEGLLSTAIAEVL